MVADILDVFPKDQMVTSQDGKAYDEAVRRWADNAQRQAKVVVLPRTSEDVSKAIRYAVANDLEIAIRGGGHSCSGASSSDGLVIDLRHFASVSVDQDKRLLIVGGGAIWETVDREAAKYGLATVGGTVNHTGVGGLTLGGGYGWLTGDYGLALDNVVQAEVVIANGDILTCNAMENTDLFWAIRGGGSNFGVITAFVFQAHPQPNLIWSGLTVFAPDNLPAIVQASQKISKLPPKGRTSCIIFSCPRPALEPAIVFLPFYNGPEEVGRAMFKPILDIGPLTDMTRQMPYEQQNALFNDVTPVGGRKLMKSAYIGAEIDEGVIMNLFRAFVKLLEQYRELKPSIIVVDLHPFQKIMEVPPDGTAFANRGPLYNLSMLLWWTNPELDGAPVGVRPRAGDTCEGKCARRYRHSWLPEHLHGQRVRARRRLRAELRPARRDQGEVRSADGFPQVVPYHAKGIQGWRFGVRSALRRSRYETSVISAVFAMIHLVDQAALSLPCASIKFCAAQRHAHERPSLTILGVCILQTPENVYLVPPADD
ncbi:FAD-dependent oxidoreductase [Phanerochaete sordida]|uniref:FAD-dependent oxidoreductase n=1 Tax=Phanerochaete sordida TaxID=48140 RepID=A0A9P3LP83_9APHY|nr:FAD-dependent oxidoreductase [Phanerochaete sordida]